MELVAIRDDRTPWSGVDRTEAATPWLGDDAIERAHGPEELFGIDGATSVDLSDKPEFATPAAAKPTSTPPASPPPEKENH